MEAAEAADYAPEYVQWGGVGVGGWIDPATPSSGTSTGPQRDALVKVETKYDN